MASPPEAPVDTGCQTHSQRRPASRLTRLLACRPCERASVASLQATSRIRSCSRARTRPTPVEPEAGGAGRAPHRCTRRIARAVEAPRRRHRARRPTSSMPPRAARRRDTAVLRWLRCHDSRLVHKPTSLIGWFRRRRGSSAGRASSACENTKRSSRVEVRRAAQHDAPALPMDDARSRLVVLGRGVPPVLVMESSGGVSAAVDARAISP